MQTLGNMGPAGSRKKFQPEKHNQFSGKMAGSGSGTETGGPVMLSSHHQLSRHLQELGLEVSRGWVIIKFYETYVMNVSVCRACLAHRI